MGRSRAKFVGLLCWAWLCAQPLCAQSRSDVDRTTARELGREALVALAAHDYAKAEERLDRALSLHQAPTLFLARARARQGLGKLLSAAEDFRAVLRFADTPEEHKSFAKARLDARAELDRLEPQLPHLSLHAPKGVARVTVNGVEWPPAALGIARPLDPGPYEIEVTSTSGATKTYRILLGIGQNRQLTLEIEPLHVRALQPLTAAATVRPEVPALAPTSTAPQPQAGSRVPAYVLGGATLVLVAGAIVTGVIALDKRADFNRRNQPEVSAAEKQELRSSASSWAWINTGIWAAALASAGVTTYVFVVTGDSDAARPNAGMGVQLGATGRF